MTKYFEIYENYALNNITDIELNILKDDNPAQFGRKMIPYMLNAIGLFVRPDFIIEKLEDRINAEYDEIQIILDEKNTKNLLTEKIGYDFVNATRMRGIDEDTGVPVIENIKTIYNKETGEITFIDTMYPNDDIDIDFYKDGYFNSKLSGTEKRILGLCLQLCWQNKFINKEEDLMLIIEDRQTKIANQANRNNSLTNRYDGLYDIIQYEMRQYETSCVIKNFRKTNY